MLQTHKYMRFMFVQILGTTNAIPMGSIGRFRSLARKRMVVHINLTVLISESCGTERAQNKRTKCSVIRHVL